MSYRRTLHESFFQCSFNCCSTVVVYCKGKVNTTRGHNYYAMSVAKNAFSAQNCAAEEHPGSVSTMPSTPSCSSGQAAPPPPIRRPHYERQTSRGSQLPRQQRPLGAMRHPQVNCQERFCSLEGTCGERTCARLAASGPFWSHWRMPVYFVEARNVAFMRKQRVSTSTSQRAIPVLHRWNESGLEEHDEHGSRTSCSRPAASVCSCGCGTARVQVPDTSGRSKAKVGPAFVAFTVAIRIRLPLPRNACHSCHNI